MSYPEAPQGAPQRSQLLAQALQQMQGGAAQPYQYGATGSPNAGPKNDMGGHGTDPNGVPYQGGWDGIKQRLGGLFGLGANKPVDI